MTYPNNVIDALCGDNGMVKYSRVYNNVLLYVSAPTQISRIDPPNGPRTYQYGTIYKVSVAAHQQLD